MDVQRSIRCLALAVGTAVAAGCAASEDLPAGGVSPERSHVVVDNRGGIVGTVTIYLYDRDGFRQRLGTVTLNEERTFEIRRGGAAEYRLVAQGGLDRDLASRPFTVSRGDVVVWDLELNRITYRGGT